VPVPWPWLLLVAVVLLVAALPATATASQPPSCIGACSQGSGPDDGEPSDAGHRPLVAKTRRAAPTMATAMPLDWRTHTPVLALPVIRAASRPPAIPAPWRTPLPHAPRSWLRLHPGQAPPRA